MTVWLIDLLCSAMWFGVCRELPVPERGVHILGRVVGGR